MGVSKGDYLGFTYNGKHSSSFGIVRISDGSRFNENLLPTFLDKVVSVPGGDGAYFFGTTYGPKLFNVSFAFDEVDEENLRKMKQWLGDKKIHSLIFDELPYKEYQAKVTGSASIKYVPFGLGKTNRLYKGEGSILFTAYYPYARAPYKSLKEYRDAKISNISEWSTASGIKEDLGDIDKFHMGKIKIYNPGDVDTDWNLIIDFKGDYIPNGVLRCDNESLYFLDMTKKGTDKGIIFNSSNNLVEGYYLSENNKKCKSGNIYNEFLSKGSFFKIPPCTEGFFNVENLKSESSIIEDGSLPLEYSYLYF